MEVEVGISPLSPLTHEYSPHEISFTSLIPPANFFFFKRGGRRELLRTQKISSPLNDYKNLLWVGLNIRKTGLYVKSTLRLPGLKAGACPRPELGPKAQG